LAEGFDLAEELGGLALGGGDEDGFGVWVVDGVVEGADGGRRRFAPLAAAIDEDAAVGGIEDEGLLGVWGEGEVVACPLDGACWASFRLCCWFWIILNSLVGDVHKRSFPLKIVADRRVRL
jgi:hypothetical protein